MKNKILMALGIARTLVRNDYVAKGLRREFKRLGRNTLNHLNDYADR